MTKHKKTKIQRKQERFLMSHLVFILALLRAMGYIVEKKRKQPRQTKKSSKKHGVKKGKKRKASKKQLAVRRKFKAFIKKHHRPPHKGEHL